MRLVNVKQNTNEWIKFRQSHICASDAPIIMGVSPWKKCGDLYKEKLELGETIENPFMLRGKELEPIALEKFEEETGLTMFSMVAKHEYFDWMAASFDGVSLERDAIVEIKCPGKKDHALAMSGKIPPKYYPQLQHQLCVSGIEFCYYYSFDGCKGKVLELKRDKEFIDQMIEKEIIFCQTLLDLQKSLEEKRGQNAAIVIV